MKKLLIALALVAGVLSAQTEVRQAIALPSYKDLKYAPLPPLKIPDPVTFTLPNGMRVYLLEDHELPVISGSALIRTGNLFDPAALPMEEHGLPKSDRLEGFADVEVRTAVRSASA